MEFDYAFQLDTACVRFGCGVTRELGMDLADMGLKRVMIVTDPNLSKMVPVETVLDSVRREKIDYSLYDQARVEPTDSSFKEAIDFAKSGSFDGFVAVGGGSSIDTAKAANLYSTYPPDDFIDYVNAPIGRGIAVPGELKPLIAVPTTAGTGSELSGIAAFDFEAIKTKTGIAHRYLKPTTGLIDPENTRTQPKMVAASTGLDVLVNALESYTALPFDKRPLPARPKLRPVHQGSNAITDMWSLQMLRMIAENIVRASEDPSDDEARTKMLMAVSLGKIGFAYAGCHLPHAMSYPVAGMIRDYRPVGYPVDHVMVPHGIAVVVNSPAVFRFTAPACPEKHLLAAEAMGADISTADTEDAGKILSDQIIALMKRLHFPNGLRALGYGRDDISKMREGAMSQQRLVNLSPRRVGPAEMEQIFEDAMIYW